MWSGPTHVKPTNAALSVRSRIDLIDYVTGIGNGAIHILV